MPTLKTYRQRCAEELGEFLESTATSGSTITMLEDTAWPVKSSTNGSEYYKDKWLFRPNAATSSDRTRLVYSYTPGSGQLTPDRGWNIAAYASGTGELYEVHSIIPPLDLHTLINRVLKERILLDNQEVTGTPTADKTRHSLSTIASWLTNPLWVFQAGWLDSTDDRNETDPYRRVVRGWCERYNNTVVLNHPHHTFQTTDTIYAKVIKPAYYHCRAAGGTWGTQSGLTLETDEALPDEDWVAAGVLVEAWKRYGHLLDATGNQRISRDRAEAAALFSKLTLDNFHPPGRRLRPLTAWGPPL